MTGASLSTTVTSNEVPDALGSLQLTGVVPMPKNDPEAGRQVIGPQVALPVGVGNVTTAPASPGSLLTAMLKGRVMVQADVPPLSFRRATAKSLSRRLNATLNRLTVPAATTKPSGCWTRAPASAEAPKLTKTCPFPFGPKVGSGAPLMS